MTEQARTAIESFQNAPKRPAYSIGVDMGKGDSYSVETIVGTDKPKEAIPKRSPTLDLLVGEGKLMWRECVWCHAFLGYAAVGNETIHEICKPCSEILIKDS